MRLRTVADRGGLLSVNHPLAADCCWRMPLDEPALLAEVWQSSWLLRTWGAAGLVAGLGPGDGPARRQRLPPPGQRRAARHAHDLGAVRRRRRPRRRGGRPHCRQCWTRDGPLLLRCGDELVVLGGDGALLTGFDRGRRVVWGDAARFPAKAGPSWVEDDHMQVLALCG